MDMINEYSIPAYLDSNELTFELETVIGFEHILFPVLASEYELKPQVKVKIDHELEKSTQQSVDKGHSPWRLDSLFTAQVFTSLHLFPEGIVGEFPIEYENLKLITQDNQFAIVQINDSDTNIIRVYLNKLIRQDETGIWTVVGYDISK